MADELQDGTGGAAGGEPGGGPSAAAAGPLFVVDPSADERERLAAAADRIGREVRGVEPELPGPALVAALAEAGAALVAWDLGGRAGLDLVEALARDARTARLPVVMSGDAPVRGAIELALRAGACSFVARPVDPDELRARLEAGR